MRFACNSLHRSNNNIAIWIAIYSSILFSSRNHSSSNHHPIAAAIAAVAVILTAAVLAWFYCRKRNAA